MTERRHRLSLLCALALLAAPQTLSAAELDGGVSVTSRYVYRGIDMSDGEPAVQGRIEVGLGGLYAGVWASSVASDYDDRSAEVDVFAGYQRRLHPALALDATVVRYTYQGGGVGSRYDWTEGQLTAHLRDHWSLTAGLARDWYGFDADTWSLEGSWHYAPGPRWLLDATLGHNAIGDAVGFDYQWAEVGLTRQLGPLHARVGYSATTGAAAFGDLTRDRWILSLGWDPGR